MSIGTEEGGALLTTSGALLPRSMGHQAPRSLMPLSARKSERSRVPQDRGDLVDASSIRDPAGHDKGGEQSRVVARL